MTKRRVYQNIFPYFITLNLLNKTAFFEETIYACLASELLLESAKQYDVLIYAFCIMQEHIHVLFKTNPEILISEYIRNYKSYYYHQMSKKFSFKDKFWQNRYDFQVKDDLESFNTAIEYIKNNPEKAGLPNKFHKTPYLYINKMAIQQEQSSYRVGFHPRDISLPRTKHNPIKKEHIYA